MCIDFFKASVAEHAFFKRKLVDSFKSSQIRFLGILYSLKIYANSYSIKTKIIWQKSFTFSRIILHFEF